MLHVVSGTVMRVIHRGRCFRPDVTGWGAVMSRETRSGRRGDNVGENEEARSDAVAGGRNREKGGAGQPSV